MEKALIKKARQANLAEYLLSVGVPLVREGNRHKHKEHDSLTFTENSYYWNSRREHGNAIDYLTKHMNISFIDAVLALTGGDFAVRKSKVGSDVFSLGDLCDNQDKVRQYLDKTRLVGYGVIDLIVNKKLLFQEVRTNNAVFPMYDESDNVVGAELQGITAKRFKGIKGGSKYGYGFNVRFEENNIFDYALFFESAIDLLSFIDFKLYHEKKSLNRCILVSMSGLKINIVKHSLKAFAGDLNVVLCVDNDEAGRAFIEEVDGAGVGYKLCLPDEQYKDWSEQMIDVKKYSNPIGRALKRAGEFDITANKG